MSRNSLEAICTSLAVFLLAALVFLTICGVFDAVLDWDVLWGPLEKLATLVMGSLAILLGACVLVSVMLNISIIANKIREIADGGLIDD